MCHIKVPPLRERKKDILPLARYFFKKHALKNEKDIDSLAQDLADRLLEYPFPGNVRELENIMAAAILLEKGKVLTLSSVIDLLGHSEPGQGCHQELISLSELERMHIQKVLEAMNGNRTRAAKILGIGLRTLQRKIKTFGTIPTASM
jgi:transcriptional regulator with PAS, ATPase and Fis domain